MPHMLATGIQSIVLFDRRDDLKGIKKYKFLRNVPHNRIF